MNDATTRLTKREADRLGATLLVRGGWVLALAAAGWAWLRGAGAGTEVTVWAVFFAADVIVGTVDQLTESEGATMRFGRKRKRGAGRGEAVSRKRDRRLRKLQGKAAAGTMTEDEIRELWSLVAVAHREHCHAVLDRLKGAFKSDDPEELRAAVETAEELLSEARGAEANYAEAHDGDPHRKLAEARERVEKAVIRAHDRLGKGKD